MLTAISNLKGAGYTSIAFQITQFTNHFHLACVDIYQARLSDTFICNSRLHGA